ncbi:MAG: HAD-IA family hydrolase [Acidobacteria bacterium]|nr:HAD-IA family hydrolase [Acidobacteriota bacterium]
MARYDAVLFDACETLLHPHPSFPEAVRMLLARRGIASGRDGADRIQEAFDEAFRALGRAPFTVSPEVSRRFWTGLYAGMLSALAIDDGDGTIAGYLYAEFSCPERYVLFPDALPALRELRARGYRVGVVSNFEAWLGEMLERLGVAPLLDVSAISGIEGVEKPDPRIFESALGRLGLPAERVACVGDSPSVDIEPALALGMGALLLDRHGRHPGRPAIHTLEQVPAALA